MPISSLMRSTAHARGAVEIDPQVDTLFEIGGQDAKYISIANTHPLDFDMNKVCAAGTGVFSMNWPTSTALILSVSFRRLPFLRTSR